jgi:hypothetical protein
MNGALSPFQHMPSILVPHFLGRQRVKALGVENSAPSSVIIEVRNFSFTQDLSNSAL